MRKIATIGKKIVERRVCLDFFRFFAPFRPRGGKKKTLLPFKRVFFMEIGFCPEMLLFSSGEKNFITVESFSVFVKTDLFGALLTRFDLIIVVDNVTASVPYNIPSAEKQNLRFDKRNNIVSIVFCGNNYFIRSLNHLIG